MTCGLPESLANASLSQAFFCQTIKQAAKSGNNCKLVAHCKRKKIVSQLSDAFKKQHRPACLLLEHAAALAGTKWKIISSKEVADCKEPPFMVAQVNQLQDLQSLIDGSSVVDRTRSGTGQFTKVR